MSTKTLLDSNTLFDYKSLFTNLSTSYLFLWGTEVVVGYESWAIPN